MPDHADTAGRMKDQALRAGLAGLIGPLRRYARSLCGEAATADDLVQETLLRALAASPNLTGGELRAWLFTALRNHWLDGLRRQGRERRDRARWPPTAASPATQGDRLALASLAAAIQTLPALQREALLLVGAEGLSIEEAARFCGVAAGTLSARVTRARSALRYLLGPQI